MCLCIPFYMIQGIMYRTIIIIELSLSNINFHQIANCNSLCALHDRKVYSTISCRDVYTMLRCRRRHRVGEKNK